MVSIIVAADPNGVIGKGNTIPWYLPEDLKLFKKRTLGSSIVMGHHTWDSLPKKPLVGRINFIISHGPGEPTRHTCLEESLAGPLWYKSLDTALKETQLFSDEAGHIRDVFIIGGEQIYNLALEMGVVDQIILSRLHKTYEGDHHFYIPKGWVESGKEAHEDFDVFYFLKG
jgi:dihydrofolate reductase